MGDELMAWVLLRDGATGEIQEFRMREQAIEELGLRTRPRSTLRDRRDERLPGRVGDGWCRWHRRRHLAGAAAGGFAVAVADLSAESAASVAADIGGIGVEVDVTDTRAVDAAVARVGNALGPVDVCVNCVGWDEFRPFLECGDGFIGQGDRGQPRRADAGPRT